VWSVARYWRAYDTLAQHGRLTQEVSLLAAGKSSNTLTGEDVPEGWPGSWRAGPQEGEYRSMALRALTETQRLGSPAQKPDDKITPGRMNALLPL